MFNQIPRHIEPQIQDYMKNSDYKSLFIWGPRRAGKTTLINKLAKQLKVDKFNFDLQSDRDKFIPTKSALDRIAASNSIVLIDEVQNFPESTVVIKLLHDEYKRKVIATGSSELRQKSATSFDTLAGRYQEIFCLPLALSEILAFEPNYMFNSQVWGAFPEIFTSYSQTESTKIDLLTNILDAYVLKDVVDLYELKNQKLAKDILTKVALQLGSEVSVREIANSLGAYPTTVANYLEIFIKNYILIPLPSFKTNLRRAVSENRKLYFYDLGIRNALVKDFRDLNIRPDKGGVFENYVILELEKFRLLTNAKVNYYFYREYNGKEVDLVIEDYHKNYQVAEIKSHSSKTNPIFPLPHTLHFITPQNFSEILPKLLSTTNK